MFFHTAVFGVVNEDLRAFADDDNVCAADDVQHGSFNEHGGISQRFYRWGRLPRRAGASDEKPGDGDDEFPAQTFSTRA